MNTKKAAATVAIVLFAGAIAKADFTFGEPARVRSAISDVGYVDCLSFDGLEMYGTCAVPEGQGYYDLCVTRRGSKDDDWGPLENLGLAVNSPQGDYYASISADGLTLYFESDRPRGSGVDDIWMTMRATPNDPWGPPMNLGPTVNSSAFDGCPWISADGLELYFVSDRSGEYGGGDIYVTKRATTNDAWGAPVNLGEVVNSAYSDARLSLSPDGLLLLFSDFQSSSSVRPGGYGGSDLWMTRRASLSDPWQAPANLGPQVNGAAGECEPRISPDGSTFYWWRGSSDWQAPIIPVVDFNGDGKVDGKEVITLAEHWGQNYPLCDIGPFAWGDGIVDVQDLKVLAENIGKDVVDPTLVAYWTFDETEGDTAHDSAGTNDGRVVGQPLWQPAGGKVGGAMQFNGTTFVAAGPVLDPAVGSFSVFAWVKGGAPGQGIISQGGVTWLTANASDGKLRTELSSSGGKWLCSPTAITDADWHRVGVVCCGTDCTLCIDDNEVAKGTRANVASTSSGLYMGAGGKLSPSTFWKGLIDDVRIYNRALKP